MKRFLENLLNVFSAACVTLAGMFFLQATYHKGKVNAYRDIQDELIKLDNKKKSEGGEA